jgi:hypothetical protein
MGLKNLKVRWYSGNTYVEKPLSFTWQSVEYQVAEVTKEWRELGKRCFRVKTGDNKSFQLCYNEAKEEWSLQELSDKEREND